MLNTQYNCDLLNHHPEWAYKGKMGQLSLEQEQFLVSGETLRAWISFSLR